MCTQHTSQQLDERRAADQKRRQDIDSAVVAARAEERAQAKPASQVALLVSKLEGPRVSELAVARLPAPPGATQTFVEYLEERDKDPEGGDDEAQATMINKYAWRSGTDLLQALVDGSATFRDGKPYQPALEHLVS